MTLSFPFMYWLSYSQTQFSFSQKELFSSTVETHLTVALLMKPNMTVALLMKPYMTVALLMKPYMTVALLMKLYCMLLLPSS